MRDADLIVVMDAGRVVEIGRHDDLVAGGQLYAKLSRLQLSDDAGGDSEPEPLAVTRAG